MTLSLANKHVLVTGSTDGLGKATALRLAKEGAQVILHGRSKQRVANILDQLQKLYPSGHFETIVCNLENPEEVEKAFLKMKTVDILINNAGIFLEGGMESGKRKELTSLVTVNTLAPLLISRVLLPKLLKSDFGQILNVVSTAGIEIPVGYYHTVYTATKYAMQGLSEALAKEFYNKNLRVMGFYPGGMETNIYRKAKSTLKPHEPWMFDVQEAVDAIVFMLTRSKKVNIKRMDLINQLTD